MRHRPNRATLLALALSLAMTATALPVAAATLVVANKGEATASLIELDTGQVRATLATGEAPHEVGISPDGRLALITDYGNRGKPGSTLTLIDIPGAAVVKTIDLGAYRRPHGVVWLDGARAVVTAEHNRALLVVDVKRGKVETAIDTDQETSHMVAVSPDGKRAYVANIGSNSLTVIDLENKRRLANIETDDGAEGVAVAHGGKHVWVTNRAADTISVIDAASFEIVAAFPRLASRSAPPPRPTVRGCWSPGRRPETWRSTMLPSPARWKLWRSA